MNKICLTVLICSFMGCEKKNEIVDLEKEEITRPQQKSTHPVMRDVEKKPSIVTEKSNLEQQDSLVRIAYKAIVGKVNIPEGVEAKVEVLGDITIVTWPVILEDTSNQGYIIFTSDYYARVKINNSNNEVIEILGN